MYFLSLPFKIGGDLRDDDVNLLDDGVDLLSNAGRSSMTTITHIALLLWFEIGIWPPPLLIFRQKLKSHHRPMRADVT